MKQPKPFYRAPRQLWYVQLDGRQINLGPDEEQAWAKYHELMAAQAKAPKLAPQAPGKPACPLVVAVLEQFLAWLSNRVAEGTKARRTYDWYHTYLSSFGSFAMDTDAVRYRVRDLTIDQLEPFHVTQWADAQPGWKTGKRGAMTAVQRAFNWGAKSGLLKPIGGVSPIRSLEKPQAGRRELLVAEEHYRQVLARVRDQNFRDLIELSWETGARPAELFTVQAAYVDLGAGRWVFPIKESKGKKVQRVVYLSDRALEITRRVASQNPIGPMLRNTDEKPWCKDAVKCRFRRLKAVLGVQYNLYSFRHTYATTALTDGGVDVVTLSHLLGHRDSAMLSRVYAHCTQKNDHMRASANQVRRAKGA